MGWKGARVATRENRLQLLHGGLKRVQERGARYQVTDELRIPAAPLDDRGCHTFAPSLDSRASVHSGGGERKKRAETSEVVAGMAG